MAAVSGAMLLTMVPEVPADAAGVCSINTNKTYQYIRGFGGIDLPEWQGYSLSDAELARAFGNGSGQLGLSVLRVYINPDRNQWNKGLKTAQYAAKAGATIFATPWEPPAALAESGGNNGKLHLPSYNYGAYATHLNDFGNYMKNNGVNLYSISVQNEPDYAHDWTYWTPMETTNFIANYGDKITSAKLMSPETFQYGAWGNGRDYYNNILNNSKANANIDVFGTHFYGTPRSKMDFPALENSGREIWMTEVYVPNSNANSANNWPEALDVAENIHNGLVVGNMSVYTWWYIKRSYSLIEQNGSNGAITKRGYMMGQYSKYVRPGDYRIDCTESPDSNLLISAYKHSDTQIEIVAINKGNTDVSQQFSVDGRTITDVDRYRTTSSENLACTSNMEHGTSSYWSYLPAKSVSTFVVKLKSDGSTLPTNPDPSSGSTEVNPDSNGYYFHDTFEDSANGWEARGGNTELTLSGRHPYAGTNALLVQKRESAWQGVQKTLDSSTYKPGQKYSFSVLVDYEDGEASQDFLLSMQYKDSSGTTKYLHIAEGTTYPGQYLQLKNPSFQIPSDASDVMIYVETKDVTGNFYIDEAIVAKDGVNISGPAAPTAPSTSTTTTSPTTTTPVYPEKTSLTYNVSSRQFRVSWTSVPNAQAYGIGYYSGGKWKVFTDSISSSATSWTSPKIPSGKYKVVILAKVNGQWETKSINSRAFTVTIS
jgi:glucuronoarabinoxylan endo-1,4-beta-xylanase